LRRCLNENNLLASTYKMTLPIWIVFIIVITIAAIYVQTKFLLKRRRIKKRKQETLKNAK